MVKQKNKKIILLIYIVLLFFSILFSPIVSSKAALSRPDGINDICFLEEKNGEIEEICNQSSPHLDIVKVIREPIDEDGELKLTILINGKIKNDENVHYLVWYNNSRSKYFMNYSNGINYGWARNIDDELVFEIREPYVTDHSVTVTYELLNSSFPHEEIEGIAYEVDDSILRLDRSPNEKKEIETKPFNGTINPPSNFTDDGDSIDTPGFEITIIVLLFVFIAIFYHKKIK